MNEDLLQKLSTVRKINSNDANRAVAAECAADKTLLVQIAQGMLEKNAGIVADCAEVMTMVSEQNPELVAPFARELAALITTKNKRARWEATHALANVARLKPEIIAENFVKIESALFYDDSVIVRDYSIEILVNYALSDEQNMRKSVNILLRALSFWKERHAGRILVGLSKIALLSKEFAQDFLTVAKEFENSEKPSVKTAARKLLRAII